MTPGATTTERSGGTRQRLEHVDAMRPVKQAAVISTHVWVLFAPLALVGVAMIFRFSRDAFLFVSAAMLTYSYRNEVRVELATYWKRRCSSVVVPYVIWTAIYFVYRGSHLRARPPFLVPQREHLASAAGLHHFLFILCTGYFQLYFLLVLLQFYVVFPVLLAWLQRHPGHIWLAISIAVVLQVALSLSQTARLFTFPVSAFYCMRLAIFYPIYLVGGMVVALRLEAVHDWVLRRRTAILWWTLASLALLVGLYVAEDHHAVPHALYTQGQVFSVAAIPYNSLMIACLYLLGVYLVSPLRSLRTRAIVQSGSDNAYGVYLSQALWFPILLAAQPHVARHWPWPVTAVVALAATYGAGLVLTAVLARTPLAKPVVGRSRASWRTLLPRRHLAAPVLHDDLGDGPMDVVTE